MNTIVTETVEKGEEVVVDVYTKLSEDRILFISDFIDDKLATDICATLLLKDAESSDEKITLFINSNGGDIRNVFMIYDVMNMIKSPVETVCIGAAVDEPVVLLASGTPGMRLATKNSMICVSQLIHDYTTYADLTEAKTILTQSLNDNKRMMEIISKFTHHPLKKVLADFERKVFMSANQALKYGIIDRIIGK
jgi:ATP-dependent Clp protease protease subunit